MLLHEHYSSCYLLFPKIFAPVRSVIAVPRLTSHCFSSLPTATLSRLLQIAHTSITSHGTSTGLPTWKIWYPTALLCTKKPRKQANNNKNSKSINKTKTGRLSYRKFLYQQISYAFYGLQRPSVITLYSNFWKLDASRSDMIIESEARPVKWVATKHGTIVRN